MLCPRPRFLRLSFLSVGQWVGPPTETPGRCRRARRPGASDCQGCRRAQCPTVRDLARSQPEDRRTADHRARRWSSPAARPASNLEHEGSPSAVVATSQRDGRTIDRRDRRGRRPLWRLHYSQPLRRRRVRPALTAAYSNQSSHTPPHAGSFVRSAVRKSRAEIVARLH